MSEKQSKEVVPSPIANHIAGLLENGKFSDLTLICEEYAFHVHRNIVCARSPVWTAAVGGNFKEATVGAIKVEIVDAVTLRRALTYLYTGDYDEMNPLPYVAFSKIQVSGQELGSKSTPAERETTNVSPNNLPRDSVESHAEALEQTPLQESQSTSSEEQHQSKRQKTTHNESTPVPQLSPGQEASASCSTSNDKPNLSDSNHKLYANAQIFLLADYYQIPALKTLAVQKFQLALKDFSCDGLSYICALVYGSLPQTADALRKHLSDAIAAHSTKISKDPSFMDYVLCFPELLRDMFSAKCLQYEASEGSWSGLLQTETTRTNAENKAKCGVIDVMQNHISRVNQIKDCKNCRLKNILRYEGQEAQQSQLGKTWMLQCKCGAKF